MVYLDLMVLLVQVDNLDLMVLLVQVDNLDQVVNPVLQVEY